MNYIGSKLRLTEFLVSNINEIVPQLNQKSFVDLFAGSGIVGKAFKSRVKNLISNDIEYYSYVLNYNYIKNTQEIFHEDIIDSLNQLAPQKGFIYNNYCLGSGSGRFYYSDYNGMMIDAIRIEIERYKENKTLYFFLLASLLESSDRISNTASVYGSFLKSLKPMAQNKFELFPALYECDENSFHEVYNEDSNRLIQRIDGDVLYLDPPYNGRQYGYYYHLLNTIAKYDTFIPKGKIGLREYYRSSYSKTNEAIKSFEELIKNAKFEYIFLSYNNEGLISIKEIQNIMSKYGRYEQVSQRHKRFKADNRAYKSKQTDEYLHILHKNKG